MYTRHDGSVISLMMSRHLLFRNTWCSSAGVSSWSGVSVIGVSEVEKDMHTVSTLVRHCVNLIINLTSYKRRLGDHQFANGANHTVMTQDVWVISASGSDVNHNKIGLFFFKANFSWFVFKRFLFKRHWSYPERFSVLWITPLLKLLPHVWYLIILWVQYLSYLIVLFSVISECHRLGIYMIILGYLFSLLWRYYILPSLCVWWLVDLLWILTDYWTCLFFRGLLWQKVYSSSLKERSASDSRMCVSKSINQWPYLVLNFRFFGGFLQKQASHVQGASATRVQ